MNPDKLDRWIKMLESDEPEEALADMQQTWLDAIRAEGRGESQVVLPLPAKLRARLDAAVARDASTRKPPRTVEEWAIEALRDCIEASEDAAGIGCCSRCEATGPLGGMALHAETGALVCKACVPVAWGIWCTPPDGSEHAPGWLDADDDGSNALVFTTREAAQEEIDGGEVLGAGWTYEPREYVRPARPAGASAA